MIRSETLLSLWTVYDHPTDMPDYFVARRFVLDKPTDDVLISHDLDALRKAFMEQGLVKLYRSDDDDPKIVETWI